MNNLSYFRFDLFSKYRDVLFGIAILGVIIGHSLTWSDTIIGEDYFLRFLNFIRRAVHTRGFLLLSGLGLMYSMSKNNKVLDFYKRRFIRLAIPFVSISCLFYLSRLFINGDTLFDWFLNQTTLKFWYSGDYGMWYISASFVLYAVFPLLYKLLMHFKDHMLFLTALLSILFYFVAALSCDYINNGRAGITQMPMFFWGMYLGYRALEKKGFKNILVTMVVLLSLFLASWYCQKSATPSVYLIGYEIYECVECFIQMCLLSVIFNLFDNNAFVIYLVKVLKWFGKYTLELYILHMLLHYLFDSFQYFQTNKILCVLLYSTISLLLCAPAQKVSNKICDMFTLKLKNT